MASVKADSRPFTGKKKEKPMHSLFAGATAGAIEAYVHSSPNYNLIRTYNQTMKLLYTGSSHILPSLSKHAHNFGYT